MHQDELLHAKLSAPSLETFKLLIEVEEKLDEIERLRNHYLPLTLPVLLVSKEFKENYNQVLSHHRSLLAEVTARKEALTAAECPEEVREETAKWAVSINESLFNVLTFIKEVERSRALPERWDAPSEFSYVHSMLY